MIKIQDYREFLSGVADKSIDCVITDPPYWTLNKHRNVGTTTRLGGHKDPNKQDDSKWFPTIEAEDLWNLMHELWRVLKPNTHCYIMCDHETLRYVLSYGDDMDWRKVKPLIWDKVNQGMGYTYRCRYEFIVFLEKGKRKLNDLGIPDILTVKKITGRYPTEKPVDLMKILIEQSSQRGELILDPFMGSCSVGMACQITGRKFTGCDINPGALKYWGGLLV